MYRTSVTRFCEYLVSKSLNSFQDLTPILIKDFNLADVHKTAEAKNAYNCRIRKFLQYLERKEAVARGISISLYSNAAPRESIVTILSDEEKDVINQFGSAAHTSIELRDYAIVMIGLFMGLRSIDIVQIKLSDIDWEKQSIRVLQEKTDYEIEVPMPTEVGNAIYRYIKYGRPKTDCLSLFVKNRAPYDSVVRAVCADALRRTLTLAKDVGFHITRRTFATDQLLNEVDQQTLIELMGHKDPSSLHRYLLHDEEKMRMFPISMAEAQIPFRGTLYD